MSGAKPIVLPVYEEPLRMYEFSRMSYGPDGNAVTEGDKIITIIIATIIIRNINVKNNNDSNYNNKEY